MGMSVTGQTRKRGNYQFGGSELSSNESFSGSWTKRASSWDRVPPELDMAASAERQVSLKWSGPGRLKYLLWLYFPLDTMLIVDSGAGCRRDEEGMAPRRIGRLADGSGGAEARLC